jgi:hypothetical protein
MTKAYALTFRAAWIKLVEKHLRYDGGFLCHRIQNLLSLGEISAEEAYQLHLAVEAKRKRDKRVSKARMVEYGLWPYSSKKRLNFMLSEIDKLNAVIYG